MLSTLLIQFSLVYVVCEQRNMLTIESLTSEATHSATQLAILPYYTLHELFCIALPPHQKLDLILVLKFFH